MKRICMAALVVVTWATGLSAQVMNSKDAPDPVPKAQSAGPVNPYFWIGGKAVVTAGRNLETSASGLNFADSWASFNVALVDSRYDIPKRFAVGEDPGFWSGFFALKSPTARINSWETSTELNWPSWQAGVQGQGFRFGLLSQAGVPVLGGNAANVPALGKLTISGADRAIVLGDRTAGQSTYLATSESLVSVAYPVTGLAFASWESPQLVKLALGIGSQGDLTSADKKGWAASLTVEATPWGSVSMDNPVAAKFQASAVAGVGYPDTTTESQDGNPFGTGLGAQVDFSLDDDLTVSPQIAFDLRLNDTAPGVILPVGTLKTEWKASAGVVVGLSPKRWINDDYGDAPAQGAGYQNFEYAKVQKFAYVQLLADLSRATIAQKQRDIDLIARWEEPDGMVGFDENLGMMVEVSKTNVLLANPGQTSDWALSGRVAYDLMAHKYTPYVRVFTDSTKVFRFRTGVQFSPLPGCAVEVTYMSPNLSKDTMKNTAFHAGRIELTVGLSSDSSYTRTAKNMNFQ